MTLPEDWLEHVNRAQSEAELEALRRCINRGQPYGTDKWVRKAATRLGLETTLRPRGRPRKSPDQSGQGEQNAEKGS